MFKLLLHEMLLINLTMRITKIWNVFVLKPAFCTYVQGHRAIGHAKPTLGFITFLLTSTKKIFYENNYKFLQWYFYICN